MAEFKKINYVYIYRAVILALYSFFFLILIKSGAIVKFVHPRYNILLIISCVLSGLIIIAMLFSANKTRNGTISCVHVFIFIFPLLTAFFTRNMDMNYSDTFSSGSVVKSAASGSSSENENGEYIPDFVMNARKSNSFELTDKHFVPILNDIYGNPGVYSGKYVSVTGMAFKRKMAPDKNEFAIVRMVMVCCAADMEPAGFICRYSNGGSVKNNGWYVISGKLDVLKDGDSDIPVIIVEKADAVKRPENEYVYPF